VSAIVEGRDYSSRAVREPPYYSFFRELMTEKGWTVMKRTSMVVILVLGVVVAVACKGTTPQTQTSSTGTVLVKELPAGVEGVELRDGALRLKDGYDFVKGPGGTFTVSRIQVPSSPATGGGCGCSGAAGGCEPVLKGGIIVCEGGCGTGSCGLALTAGGVKTDIIKW
jgi:hypothetical protein